MPKKDHPFSDQYLVYTRKSTDDSDNQKNSIPYQTGEGLRFGDKNNLPVAKNCSVEGFCEEGVITEKHTAFKNSGLIRKADGSFSYDIERPKFKLMVDALMKKEFKGVICLCWDRISRNDQDGMVIKALIAQGVDVQFVQTMYEKTSSGALIMVWQIKTTH